MKNAIKEIKKTFATKRNIENILICGSGNSVRSKKHNIIKFITDYNPLKIAINGVVFGLLEICNDDELDILMPDILFCSIERIHFELFKEFFLSAKTRKQIENKNTLVIADNYYVNVKKYFSSAMVGDYKKTIANYFKKDNSMSVGGSIPFGFALMLKPKIFAYVGIADSASKYKYLWRKDSINWNKWKMGKRNVFFDKKNNKWYLENNINRAKLQNNTFISEIKNFIPNIICLNEAVEK